MDNWVLLVVVIVIIYVITTRRALCEKYLPHFGSGSRDDVAQSAESQDDEQTSGDSSTTTTGLGSASHESMEQRMILDGISGSGVEVVTQDGQCPTDSADRMSGMNYSEWVAGQSIDPRIIESNREFVADRLGSALSWTGATWSPDRHESYDAVPWQGLSRPARVPVSSPDRIPDIDMSNNPEQQRVRWSSS